MKPFLITLHIVYHIGQWGTVCHDWFDMRDAKVACRQLGFNSAVEHWRYGRGTGKVWLDDMKCTGSESSLGSCPHPGWGTVDSACKTHNYDVSAGTERHYDFDIRNAKVKCRQLGYAKAVGYWWFGQGTGKLYILYIFRFTRTEYKNENTKNITVKEYYDYLTITLEQHCFVEVYHQGQWGTVCDDGWGMDDTKVACRQLGFTKAVGPSYLGRGTGKVWLTDMACSGTENSLESCSSSGWGDWCRSHTEDAGVVCSLLFYHSSQWGTLCKGGYSDEFDMRDVKVAYRQLGYTNTVGYWWFGRGSGKVWLWYMRCNGSESSLGNCTHNGWGNVHSACNSHTEDVGVVFFYIIKSPKMLDFILDIGFWYLRLGYRALEVENTALTQTSPCHSSHIKYSGGDCFNINEEKADKSVILEMGDMVYHSRQWGTVCHDFFDMRDAKVACRQLGYTKAVGNWRYGRGSGKVWLDDMACSGSESSLGSCSSCRWGNGDWCGGKHLYDVGVVCLHFCKPLYDYLWSWKLIFLPLIPIGSLSGLLATSLGLSRHASETSVGLFLKKIHHTDYGSIVHVQVYHSGQWGTVCQDYFDMREAKVACRQLGFTSAVGYWWNGRGMGKVWLDDMECTGSESSLGSCSHPGWGNVDSACKTHNYDVGCIIQVYHSGQWGTVCFGGSDAFDMRDAKVACRQLGYAKAVGYWWFGQGTGKVWLYNMQCTGSETSLGSCTSSGYGNGAWCSHGNDVGVQKICLLFLQQIERLHQNFGTRWLAASDNPITKSFYRHSWFGFSGIIQVYHSAQYGTVCHGSSYYFDMRDAKVACRQLGYAKAVGYWYYGRGTGKVWLKVYHSGQWGTVCHSYFDMNDGKVACRQLGYAKAVGYWQYGRGTGKVWLDNMRCTGSEPSLASCSHDGWGGHGSSCDRHQLMLVSSTMFEHSFYHSGHLETVCHVSFDMRDAIVACQQLGYAKAVGYWQYGRGTGKVYHSIQWETMSYAYFNMRDAKVEYGQLGFTKTKFLGGQWGTVCCDSFDMNDVKVACRQLGFSAAVGLWSYGQGTGKVWLNDMGCSGSESKLQNCTHSGWGSVVSECHSHQYDVGVVSYSFGVWFVYANLQQRSLGNVYCDNFELRDDAKVVSRQLRSDESARAEDGYPRVIEVYHSGQWGTVCYAGSDYFDMRDAKVACRQLGYAKAVGYWWFGQGTGKVWLTNMQCTGSETSPQSCASSGYGNGDWCGGYGADVGVPCDRSLDSLYIIYHNGQWGTVCHDGYIDAFDMRDAKVACRQLGYTKAVGYWWNGQGSGKVWLFDMQCSGSESSLGSCTHNGWGNVNSGCNSHTWDVDFRKRLSPYKCTTVVNGEQCVRLGYTKAVGYWRYGRGTGNVWLQSMECTGSEFSLASCSHGGWGNHVSSCDSHQYDVGVVCSDYTSNSIPKIYYSYQACCHE
ncbi:deleted in malignant brain tumors 1 protein-like [Actinia tenebrosa]|uniref:Deleted in malignant brain tumors 1 protein-like n=1 Tax=Actinia tenebrosa TaxID=6105 RepID=A0A6P8GX22_ACTTE|nr:deleted in malignant brain tumors 1 protein-like [Actinia tenebrosa]